MKQILENTSRTLLTALLAVLLLIPSVSAAKNADEEPSAGAMAVDAVVARPLLLITTILGAGLYVVSLPFSLLGGNAADAGKALVVGPAKSTFVRCLGCRQSGYKE